MHIINHDLGQLESANILIMSDVHIGEKAHDEKVLTKMINEIKEQPNTFAILNGDILNTAIKTSVSDSYEETLTPDQQIDKAVEILRPIKDKILVLIDGNHEERIKKNDGISIMKRVSKELDIHNVFVEDAYVLYIALGKNQRREYRRTVYSIYGRHGSGGGSKPGGTANKLDNMMAIIDTDIYIHGHTHLPLSFRKVFYRCDYRNRKVTRVEKLFVNASAMLDYDGYGVRYGFSPQSMIYPKIILNGAERETKALI